jgi:hypothetical protein
MANGPKSQPSQGRLVVVGGAGRTTVLSIVLAGVPEEANADFRDRDFLHSGGRRCGTPGCKPFANETIIFQSRGFAFPWPEIRIFAGQGDHGLPARTVQTVFRRSGDETWHVQFARMPKQHNGMYRSARAGNGCTANHWQVI